MAEKLKFEPLSERACQITQEVSEVNNFITKKETEKMIEQHNELIKWLLERYEITVRDKHKVEDLLVEIYAMPFYKRLFVGKKIIKLLKLN